MHLYVVVELCKIAEKGSQAGLDGIDGRLVLRSGSGHQCLAIGAVQLCQETLNYGIIHSLHCGCQIVIEQPLRDILRSNVCLLEVVVQHNLQKVEFLPLAWSVESAHKQTVLMLVAKTLIIVLSSRKLQWQEVSKVLVLQISSPLAKLYRRTVFFLHWPQNSHLCVATPSNFDSCKINAIQAGVTSDPPNHIQSSCSNLAPGDTNTSDAE